ncbi:hypothetical protein MI170_00245 [Mycolicibacterium goodii]|uniref:hypothetical protein n=1 Tax=Mycolicibacterium goodii TaxID=134601 RepID=UPI001F0348E0|nr:hypothetical protein [Mycolicibacterium goodii]ULN47859.1 hypothetical protein MI170_00245 [Mycolicibacterium goodii]
MLMLLRTNGSCPFRSLPGNWSSLLGALRIYAFSDAATGWSHHEWPAPKDLSAMHATVPVMTNSREESDRVGVDELLPGMTGVWLVVSQGSRHEWDLDAMTYMRIAGQDSESGRFALDGQRMPITRVGRWPRVGSTSLVFYDDPARPLEYEQFRQSSRVESITRITPTAAAGRPDDSTGYLLLDALADEDPVDS